MDPVTLTPIGIVHTDATKVPRHWSISDLEGRLVIDASYRQGLQNIEPGQRLVVLFHFHQSPPFSPDRLVQAPPHLKGPRGVFSICSPVRPNPIGLSVVEVLGIKGDTIRVKGIDMLDGTPILDLKPHVTH